jgi:hypothetical protein
MQPSALATQATKHALSMDWWLPSIRNIKWELAGRLEFETINKKKFDKT